VVVVVLFRLEEEEPLVEDDSETKYTPEGKPWLKEIWEEARDKGDGDHVYSTVLAFRHQKDLGRVVSEDIWDVDKLIEKMCDKLEPGNDAWERAIKQVRAAWTYFAFNPFSYCKPIKTGYDDNKDATMFPVTVFVKYFWDYYAAAVSECKAIVRT
jgi:hypothetical protein